MVIFFARVAEDESSNIVEEEPGLRRRTVRVQTELAMWSIRQSRMDVSEIMVVAARPRAHVIVCEDRPSISWREP